MRLDKKIPASVNLFDAPTSSFLTQLPFKSYSSIDEVKTFVRIHCESDLREQRMGRICGKIAVHVSQDGGYFKRFVMIVKN